MEIVPGAICNLGAGISTGISAVAAEENILDDMILTNEQGFIGGAPLTGVDSGTAQNYEALVDAPYQFDFYDGGGLDIAFLSFAEVDPKGNVNISRFGDKIVGVGGFINISQNARKHGIQRHLHGRRAKDGVRERPEAAHRAGRLPAPQVRQIDRADFATTQPSPPSKAAPPCS